MCAVFIGMQGARAHAASRASLRESGEIGEPRVAPTLKSSSSEADQMLSACLLVWCLGQSIAPADRATFASDVRHSDRDERIFGYETSWLVAGVVSQATAPDALFAGVLPLNMRLLGDRLMFTGGAVIASDTVPAAGTRANFMARLELQLADRFALTYWHWSNAHLGRQNPSVDSLGVTMRLRGR
jgi:hypothetical protein